jgi:hypothetical protein
MCSLTSPADDHATVIMSADRRNWKPLAPVFKAAVAAFDHWSNAHLLAGDTRNQVTTPLYHYTDAAGLEGIVKNQQVWFTRYTHLNDPSEITYGMKIASELLSEIGQASDHLIGIFYDMVNDLFTPENLRGGFALGLAPHLFGIADKPNRTPHESIFVAPVVYGRQAATQHHMPAIVQAVRIVGDTVEHAADLMEDSNVGLPFFDEMGKLPIASHLIFNSLTIKHEAYQHEQEVRLIVVGEHKNLTPSTRSRCGEIVPFIESYMPIQAERSIAEIVVGPAAAAGADDGVCALLGRSTTRQNPSCAVDKSVPGDVAQREFVPSAAPRRTAACPSPFSAAC